MKTPEAAVDDGTSASTATTINRKRRRSGDRMLGGLITGTWAASALAVVFAAYANVKEYHPALLGTPGEKFSRTEPIRVAQEMRINPITELVSLDLPVIPQIRNYQVAGADSETAHVSQTVRTTTLIEAVAAHPAVSVSDKDRIIGPGHELMTDGDFVSIEPPTDVGEPSIETRYGEFPESVLALFGPLDQTGAEILASMDTRGTIARVPTIQEEALSGAIGDDHL